MNPAEEVSLATRYSAMEADRAPFLERARDCARLTIPSVMPPEHSNSADDRESPYSAIGARGVNSLSSSISLSAFPPNTPFFRIALTQEAEALLAESGEPEARDEIDETLAGYEKAAIAEMERRGYRSQTGKVVRHLLVAGNVLVRALEGKPMRLYRLDTYVRRNFPGEVPAEVIIKETIPESDVPEEVKIARHGSRPEEEDWEMYTRVYWPSPNAKERTVRMVQEVSGIVINEASWSEDRCPYIPLAWHTEPGEDYGRSFVEDFLGELETVDSLMESIVHGAAVAAEVRCLVDPAGTTEEGVMRSPNLSVRPGRAVDVSFVQAQKFGDFSTAYQTATDKEERLGQIFLMPEASIRNKERVTATEVRMVQEATDKVTNSNTTIARDFQLPLVRLVLSQLEKRGVIQKLDDKAVDLIILTGADAMARSMDSMRLDALVADLVNTFGPDAPRRHIIIDAWLREKAVALQLSRAGLIRTEAEIQQMEQAAMQQQLAMQAGAAGAEVAGANLGAQLTEPQPQEA